LGTAGLGTAGLDRAAVTWAADTAAADAAWFAAFPGAALFLAAEFLAAEFLAAEFLAAERHGRRPGMVAGSRASTATSVAAKNTTEGVRTIDSETTVTENSAALRYMSSTLCRYE
jgi:hypothetical protein